MKTFKCLSLALLFFYCAQLHGQTSVMSFNIRFNNPNDNENCWEYRKEEIVTMLEFYHPDILGIQEGLYDQVSFLDQMLQNYSYIGVGRDDGKKQGEFAAIFFHNTKFELLETKTYWLSETPDTISVGWDASMKRIVTYGVLRDFQSMDTLYVFNCHYDHIGEIARKNSSELILNLIEKKELRDKKIIVMGDFNSEPDSYPIKTLQSKLNDSYQASEIPAYGPQGTFNDFDTSMVPQRRIDYIFVKNITVESYLHLDDRRINNLYLSDHLPVMIRVK
ncbi:MAG: endonuclease/exonuclease/phosphatase family protein [Bacteroidota bacterium]|nr:MAG: endonuclease/exonuclease/phosphatase family protein [Bacteroidota bacterium]